MARYAPKKSQMGKVARRTGTQGWKKAGEGLTCGLWRDERLSLDDVLGRNLLGTPRAKALKQRSAWYIPGMTETAGTIPYILGSYFWKLSFSLKMETALLFHKSTQPIHQQEKKIEIQAAATLLQSCPTLCDPIDGSPPGAPTPVPGILQARTREWVAIPSSNHESEKWKWGRSVVFDS